MNVFGLLDMIPAPVSFAISGVFVNHCPNSEQSEVSEKKQTYSKVVSRGEPTASYSAAAYSSYSRPPLSKSGYQNRSYYVDPQRKYQGEKRYSRHQPCSRRAGPVTRTPKTPKIVKDGLQKHDKFSQLPSGLIYNYQKKYPWIIGLAEQYLRDPAKIHSKWFFFFVRVCRCLGPGRILEEMNQGKSLYQIVSQFELEGQKPQV